MLRATETFDPFKSYVGGEDQIAILPSNGEPQFTLPPLPTDKRIIARFELWHGFRCSKSDCKSDRTTSFDDFQHPFSEPMGKLFLAGSFRESAVALDYNYFINDSFDDVTLKWQGGPVFLHGNRFTGQCVLEIPDKSKLAPAILQQLSACRLVTKPEIATDTETVGLPSKWTAIGSPCVRQNPGGGITMTAGGECKDGVKFPQTQVH